MPQHVRSREEIDAGVALLMEVEQARQKRRQLQGLKQYQGDSERSADIGGTLTPPEPSGDAIVQVAKALGIGKGQVRERAILMTAKGLLRERGQVHIIYTSVIVAYISETTRQYLPAKVGMYLR